jgi:alpha-1,6-mannosyltransferase
MGRYWTWIGMMVAVAALGSWLVHSIAFSMLPQAAPDRYHGFIVGLSLPIPVVQVAPHWYAIIAMWLVFGALGFCGWQAARAVAAWQRDTVASVYIGYVIVGVALTFFALTLSIDGYYYTFFGRLFGIYGVNPYVLVAPITINDGIFAQEFPLLHNPPFPDPYGPGFTLLAGLIGKLESNASLWIQLWTWRAVSVVACLLILAALAHIIKKVAPHERARPVAIVAFHPLTLYESGAGGHNDFLMIAAAAWSYAIVDELPLIAGLLLGVAISIKYFAAILLPFIVVRAARKSIAAAAFVVVLAVIVPLLCFHPFAFGAAGQATLTKVGSSLSMSLTWLLALPLFALKAGDTAVRSVQFAVLVAFALVTLAAIIRYMRTLCNAEVFRSITALLWSLPALHPWYAAWLVPVSAARGGWAVYAWWFSALSLLVYTHEAVLPTPLNHTIFIVITVAVLIVPIVLARASKEGARP